MKRFLPLLLAVCMAALLAACAPQGAPPEVPASGGLATEAPVVEAPVAESPAVAEPAVDTPDEAAPQADGLVFSLTTLLGDAIDDAYFSEHKLTMVNYWATWCGPCVGEIPDLIAIADEYAEKGFAILGVLFADEDIEGAKSFMTSSGVNYPVVNAEGVFAELGQEFFSIPTTFFVDENGRIITEPVVGSRTGDDWKAIIDGLLSAVG